MAIALNNNSQLVTQRAVELIFSTNVLLELAALAISRACKEIFSINLMTIVESGANLSQVNDYAIKNTQKLLEEHNTRKYIDLIAFRKQAEEIYLKFSSAQQLRSLAIFS